jgi:uncharacterized protein (TIGR02588 family)
LAGALSALLVLGIMAVLAREHFQPDAPADIQVEVLSTTAASTGYRVEISARNRGHQPAAQVTIEGRAGPELSSVVIDYLPGGSYRRATLLFRQHPGTPDIRAVSYREP